MHVRRLAGREPSGYGPDPGGTFSMKTLLQFLGFLFAAGTILFIISIGAVAGLLWHYSNFQILQLQGLEPP